MLPAITNKAAIEKLQEEFQKLLLQNWQTSATKEDEQTSAALKDDLVYRVLVTEKQAIAAYEPVNKPALDLIEKTPLLKLTSKDKESDTNQLPTEINKAINQPVAEFKVTFTSNGKVEVKWGESFLQDE